MEGQGPLCSSLDPWLYPVRSPGLATGEPPEPRSNNRTSTDQVFIGCASPNLAGPIVDQPRQWQKSHWALTEVDPRLPPAGHTRLCRPGQSSSIAKAGPQKVPLKSPESKKKKPRAHQPCLPGPTPAPTSRAAGCCHYLGNAWLLPWLLLPLATLALALLVLARARGWALGR